MWHLIWVWVPGDKTSEKTSDGLLGFLGALLVGAIGLLLVGVFKLLRALAVGLLVATVWATPKVVNACKRAWARWQHHRAVAAARQTEAAPTVAEPALALPQRPAGPFWSELSHKRPANAPIVKVEPAAERKLEASR